MWSSRPRSGPDARGCSRAVATALAFLFLLSGCSREAPDVREVRKASEEYFRALSRRHVKQIADLSTCLVSTNSFVGGRVLAVGPPVRIRQSALDSLAGASLSRQRSSDSAWARSGDADADSLFRLSRVRSYKASIYRNAARAVRLSAPSAMVAGDSTLETRAVRVRIRYAGPVIGPRPVDREEVLRLLRVPGGKWIAFSLYLREEDPAPEML